MKGDRFEKISHDLVQKMMGADALDLTAASLDMVQGAEKLVLALLRKEHAAVKREIKKHYPDYDNTSEELVLSRTITQILAALDKRAKGGAK